MVSNFILLVTIIPAMVLFQEPIKRIIEVLGIALVIRAHQVKPNGHEWLFDNRLLTLFSAPNFIGVEGNSGSVSPLQNNNP